MKKRSFKDRLEMDVAIYGASYVQLLKPTIVRRIFRPLFKLPIDKRRLDPRKIRIAQGSKTFAYES